MLLNELDYNVIQQSDITIVVPTLNEEKGIELVLKDVLSAGYPNVLVIDGNSIDGTVKVVKDLGVNIYTQVGRGKTGAIKTALNYIKTPYFVVIDGDCTYSVNDIDALLEKAPFYNEVIGARSNRENIKRLNRFGNDLINLFFNFSFSTRLTDVCSGLYILKTSFARYIILETAGFDLEVEIAAQAAESNRIDEHPISYGSRVGVQKLNPFRDGYKIFASIIKLTRRYNPLVFYAYFIGLLTLFAGLGITVFIIFTSLNGVSFPLLAYFSPIFTSVGIQLLIMAIILSELKYYMKKMYKGNPV